MQKDYPLENRLKELRMSLGLRQEDVAMQLGIECTDRLSHWEKGKAMPNVVNLLKLSILYDTAPEKLYAKLWEILSLQISKIP